MRRESPIIARVTVAVLLGVGVLMVPGRSDAVAVARSPDCPSPPVTIDQIAHLTPARALSCFGDRLLTFVAYVPPHPYGIGGATDHHISPAWLDGLSGSFVALSAGPDAGILVLAFVPPALGRCLVPSDTSACPFRFSWGRWATVRAHFDGPVARACRVTWLEPGVSFTRADAVAQCRETLIVLSVGPVVPPATATSRAPDEAPDRPLALFGIAALATASLLLGLRARAARR